TGCWQWLRQHDQRSHLVVLRIYDTSSYWKVNSHFLLLGPSLQQGRLDQRNKDLEKAAIT
ncbi:MAG: hypothetical protein AAGA73_03425, partial [Pseudomonadota bacterium]